MCTVVRLDVFLVVDGVVCLCCLVVSCLTWQIYLFLLILWREEAKRKLCTPNNRGGRGVGVWWYLNTVSAQLPVQGTKTPASTQFHASESRLFQLDACAVFQHGFHGSLWGPSWRHAGEIDAGTLLYSSDPDSCSRPQPVCCSVSSNPLPSSVSFLFFLIDGLTASGADVEFDVCRKNIGCKHRRCRKSLQSLARAQLLKNIKKPIMRQRNLEAAGRLTSCTLGFGTGSYKPLSPGCCFLCICCVSGYKPHLDSYDGAAAIKVTWGRSIT